MERANANGLTFFNPSFQVFLPSRFYDPKIAPLVGRPIDVCYEVTPTGGRAQGTPLAVSTNKGTIAGGTFDDPRSVFNGGGRVGGVNADIADQPQGPRGWDTHPVGK